jgi:ectoine hydroxylase-related dioxygenase (phytanoyl-CoA dioxygenase family)
MLEADVMGTRSETRVKQSCIEEFQEQGVTVLRSVFDDWIETLRRGVERNLSAPGPYTKGYTPEGGSGRFFGDYCNWQRIPEYEDFVRHSCAGAIAGQLMRSRHARFFHEHVLVKEPGTEERTPWHHDGPYYGIETTKSCSLWIPLDPVPEDTCVEFVAGSHRWGRVFLPRMFSGEDYIRADDDHEPIPDFDHHREDYDIRTWSLAPGDAIAFHFLTVHGAPPNLSPTLRRRAFSARWVGDDATYAVRSGRTSPPFPELVGRLNDGDSLDVPEFPIIWEAS